MADHSILIERLAEQAETLGIRSLAPEERQLIVGVTGYGLICNGGFFWLYQGFNEIELLIEAFDALELPHAAEACRRTLDALPGGEPFLELEAQAHWLEEQNQGDAPFLDYWEELTTAIDTIPHSVFDQHVDTFIRAHPQILGSH